ncbi:Na/Pi symporter [Bacillus massilinigeriensis]|uniref:Na/Pi symporter n=1 Tax=Bacillus mediterraneensis TaxID=1805474 RepID=UPI0008F7FB9C|nr:Na/Pi symporter [Bacillus mediterraneensis]
MGVVILFLLFILMFIAGMALLRQGLFHSAGSSMKKQLEKMVGSPWKGFVSGCIAAAFLHSSSAVMVLTIGLISAGLLTFRQSIGIILGSNVGTTFTLELITINIDFFIVPLAVTGAMLIAFNSSLFKNIGKVTFGIAAVFVAMRGFTFLAGPLTEFTSVESLLQQMDSSHLCAILLAAAFTALIQSSTAMTGIVMGFLAQELMEFDTALAAMLGANIGTCATALLASAGAGKEGHLTAYAHLWLNIGGALAFLPLIDSYAAIAPLTAARPEVQLAHASVLYNLVSSIAVLPFADGFSRFILKLHGRNQ